MIRIKTYIRLLPICLGALFMLQQLLVSLHFVVVEHHYYGSSEKVRISKEVDSECQVSKYFNFILKEHTSSPYSKVISNYGIKVNPKTRELYFIDESKSAVLKRGPPKSDIQQPADQKI